MKDTGALRVVPTRKSVNIKAVHATTEVTILLIQAILRTMKIEPTDEVPLRAFMMHITRHCALTMSHLLCASIYLLRLNQSRPPVSTIQNGQQLFLAAIILSHKFLDDTTKSTRVWSRCSAISISDIIGIEWELFKLLDFNVNISTIAFEKWATLIADWSVPKVSFPSSRTQVNRSSRNFHPYTNVTLTK
ncbi:PHO85 cyclin-5 [Basidiobolus ranarum]|uniref:PHO85 cyclin-5 n=1 Tax=Basidiobolus ranarum TaxID=34480 RepID=A0ABR2WR54_9FUNG